MANNYTWNYAAADIGDTLVNHAKKANVTTTGDNWIINGDKVGDTITLDDTLKSQSLVFNGGVGVDNIVASVLGTNKGTLTINTGAGDDFINVTAGTNKITIDGGIGADTITFAGTDTATLVYDALDTVNTDKAQTNKITIDASTASKALTWDLGAAVPTFAAGSSIGLGEIAGVVGSAFADKLTAGATAVKLDGGAGADTLIGGTMAATTFVYDAADALVDGKGIGILDASAQTTGISLFLDGNTVFKNMAQLTGGAGDDNLRGTGSMTVVGGKGNDLIWGGKGNFADTLTGGEGNDTFYYGYNDGSDTITAVDSHATSATDPTLITGDSKGDTVNLYNISAYDLVGDGIFSISKAGDGVINSLAGGTLTLAGAATDATNQLRHYVSKEGWTFDVAFAGVAGTLNGTAGVTDNLIAAAGGSTLDGKGDSDNLYGGAGNDIFDFYGKEQIYSGGGADTIDASVATTGVSIFTDSVIQATATKATSWTIKGSAFDDNIRGTKANDVISGGEGNDLIWGGAGGNDILTGGRGVDTYYYGLDEGNDVITAGTNKYDGNALDSVNFYNVTDVAKLSGSLVGNDLTIGVAGAQGVGTLALTGWGTTDGINKLTNIVVGGTNYTLGVNASNVATFTKVG